MPKYQSIAKKENINELIIFKEENTRKTIPPIFFATLPRFFRKTYISHL
jgi:hypothetical protein